jgi:hypothetical protein
MSFRPHSRSLSTAVRDVITVAEGFAVLTDSGIELLDPELAPIASIPGTSQPTTRRIVELADGRFVTAGHEPAMIYLGRRGGAFEPVHQPETVLVTDVIPTADGYVAPHKNKVWVDRAGEAKWVDVPDLGAVTSACAWGDRIAIAGAKTLVVIDATGAVVGRTELETGARPTAVGSVLAIANQHQLVIVGEDLSVQTKIETGAIETLRVFGDTLVVATKDAITCWAPNGEQRWRVAMATAPQAPIVIGPRVVIGSWLASTATIVDGAAGNVIATVPLRGPLRDATAFGDGIALQIIGDPDVTWWRPSGELARFDHDVEPTLVRTVGDWLATTEGRHLHIWRTDAQGPEVHAVKTSIPVGVPIVVGGNLMTIEHIGRRSLRARGIDQVVAVEPDATWRPAIAKDDALVIVHELVARKVDGEMPPGPFTGSHAELQARLGQLPLAAVAPLHARALFAPTTIDADARAASAVTRSGFYAELGAALGVNGRVIAASVRGRKYPLVPPREVPGFDFLGSFTTSGALVVADPAYVGSKRAVGVVSLALRVKGLEGLWYVYARNGEGAAAKRTAELVAIHTDGYDTYATEELGNIGVDSGCAGIYDKACPKRDRDAPVEEGIQGGLGALAFSGYGDGMYPVYAGKIRGIVVKLRLGFLEGTGVDRTYSAPRVGQAYSPRQKYALGDTVDHPKFGAGTVVAIVDSKIEVAFADSRRTLVHGKA